MRRGVRAMRPDRRLCRVSLAANSCASLLLFHNVRASRARHVRLSICRSRRARMELHATRPDGMAYTWGTDAREPNARGRGTAGEVAEAERGALI